MPSDQQFEDQLPDALRLAADDFPPPASDLVRGATARARRQRRVRATQAGAAAALTLVAVGAAVLGGSTLGDHHAAPEAVTTQLVRTGTVPPGEPRSPGPPVSAKELVATLTGLLPPGGRVTSEPPPAMPDSRTAQITYSTDEGTSSLRLRLTRLTPGMPWDGQGQGNCVPIEDHPYDVCSTVSLPGGSTLTTNRSFASAVDNTGQQLWSAVVTGPDGAQVAVEEFAGGAEGKVASTGVAPVLSTGQLGAIAASPAWRRALDSIPTPAARKLPATEDPSAAQMRSALVALLPGNGRLSDLYVGGIRAEAVWDDGNGKNEFDVMVQSGRPDLLRGMMNCANTPVEYCRATTLGDGTRVLAIKARSSTSHASIWTVDTLRPDGRRITVREANSYSPNGPVTRPRPALDLEGLQAIALSPKWAPKS
ncbi:hypothetical protein GA0115240_135220 [Streptomyces sp. DvalAA-14]|uniref:hypothetical protein n=1 Tax=unclassified Streptomyces TaxID=2593676 RepID=UPI00081B951F|nr:MULTISPECIES: hypothetical protein [unclassified Streptomyces]MYS21765.1 hypothetical protein [Streptomyces sp. SID4948]SCE00859.1 hypothetical protein GA0115240_135220 [Streptomyces sp. DvalAA-14]